ncbi:MAG: hypothetical protein E7644_01850 [Ruminococcaceae bacterium]|jgi:hypothetical protein|nr:hypothetical protein [Oscillospiraceae bacterium]
MIITDEQISILKKYIPNVDELVARDDLYELEINLDQAIIDHGMDDKYRLTREGVMLQKLYDDIYYAN